MDERADRNLLTQKRQSLILIKEVWVTNWKASYALLNFKILYDYAMIDSSNKLIN